MPLTRRSALGAVAGLAGLILSISNPNFEFKDIVQPYNVIRKFNEPSQDNSNKWYLVEYAMFAGGVIGLAINAFTGNFYRRREN